MSMTNRSERHSPPSASQEGFMLVRSIWCESAEAECFDPACRAHGCMERLDHGETSQQKEG